MLNGIYLAIKAQLKTPTDSMTGEEREGTALPVEWYNVQYEGTMIHENGFFVEFPEKLGFEQISKEDRRAPVKIRLHAYSKALQTQDGISDAQTLAHEAIAMQAKNLLDGFAPANGACKRLTLTGWQHWHRWKGWMVTFVEFEAKKVI